MENQKRTYSMNLAAYIILQSELMPEVKEDKETATYYFEFPPCAGVELCIDTYKQEKAIVNLTKFQAIVRMLKNAMREKKEAASNGQGLYEAGKV